MIEKLKILIVEDHKMTRKLLDLALKEDVFEKYFAENGQAALGCYETWKPDVILLDIMVPVMSGYTVLKKIRKKETAMKTTIIVMSGLSAKQDIMDCMNWGIQGYLVKPINFKELAPRILEHHKAAHPGKAQEISQLEERLRANSGTLSEESGMDAQ